MKTPELPILSASWCGIRDTTQTEITEGLQAGGESRRTVVRVQADGLTASLNDGCLTLRGSEREASLTLAPAAVLMVPSPRKHAKAEEEAA